MNIQLGVTDRGEFVVVDADTYGEGGALGIGSTPKEAFEDWQRQQTPEGANNAR